MGLPARRLHASRGGKRPPRGRQPHPRVGSRIAPSPSGPKEQPQPRRQPHTPTSTIYTRCLVGLALVYLRELCCPPLSAMSSRSLRSSQQGLLLVPFARTSTKQIRAFSVVGPSTWNGLPPELRIFNRTTSPAFFSHLKTALFDRAGVGSASE